MTDKYEEVERQNYIPSFTVDTKLSVITNRQCLMPWPDVPKTFHQRDSRVLRDSAHQSL